MDLTDIGLEDYRGLIRYMHEKQTWDEIAETPYMMEEYQTDSLEKFLNYIYIPYRTCGAPRLNVIDWKELVKSEQIANDTRIEERALAGAGIIGEDLNNEQNAVKIPKSRNSAWILYKQHLLEDEHWNPESIELMQDTTFRILKKMSSKTEVNKPVKGLVVGNVQSGKTANMAALMAMAADNGWNMFIILSGVIDNLRVQTQDRLISDLNARKEQCTLDWEGLVHLSDKCQSTERASAKNFTNNKRYLTVSLKNSKRLDDLTKWLTEDQLTSKNMKILIIDDEADQAGIDTKRITDPERTKINNLLVNLVHGLGLKHTFGGLNYVGYTATPYANILNEEPGNNNGHNLYPKSFIATLPVSKEYFGPQQIFGLEGDDKYHGMNIVRIVPEIKKGKESNSNNSTDEVEQMKEVHSGNLKLPETLKNAIAWFICCVAVQRSRNNEKHRPYSMLIHTTQLTKAHDKIGDAVKYYIESETDELIRRCKTVWEYETKQFSLDRFKEEYPDYGLLSEVQDYPNFSEIEENIQYLVKGNNRISHILLNDEKQITYHDGIHLCIDNYNHTKDKDNEHVRLAYPDKKSPLSYDSAFIVIGGATLSRGLTIEGLVSTYFLRTVGQSDTLMQMGRWFGYRKGYELLPRIWMDQKTRDKFDFLSIMDHELRKEIQVMEKMNLSPNDYSVKVKTDPNNIIRISSKMRIQGAVEASWNFSGKLNQTINFNNDKDILYNNLNKTKDFLNSLGKPIHISSENKHAANSIVWKNIELNQIADFLHKFEFSQKCPFFNTKEEFLKWAKENTDKGILGCWNVVLAGIEGNQKTPHWNINDDLSINMVNRSKFDRADNDTNINIGVLRAPADMYCDVDITNITNSQIRDAVINGKAKIKIRLPNGDTEEYDYNYIRNQAGLEKTPLLMLYIIDKDSVPEKRKKREETKSGKSRIKLDAPEHIVGVCVNLPGASIGKMSYEAISLPLSTIDFNDEDEIVEEDE